MDDESLDERLHVEALRGLGRINQLSFTARTLWDPIAAFARNAGRPIRVLDVATGGGDVPIALAAAAERHGADITFAGCDKSEVALQCAQKKCKEHCQQVTFFKWNAMTDSFPVDYDIAINTLFLHHLDPQDTINLLVKMSAARMVLVSDLVRCKTGLALAHVATRLLSRSRVVHVDGPRSVRAAYTCQEMLEMAEAAGLHHASIRPCWPFRMLLSWSKP